MRLLIIAPTPYFSDRGCHIRIYEELQALYQAGHKAVVYTYGLGRDLGPAPIIRIGNLPWYTKTSAGPAVSKFILDALLLWKIIRTYKRYQFDLIHAHLHEGMWIAWWVRLFMHLPIVFDAQGSLVAELDSHGWLKLPGLRWFFSVIERWLLRQADDIVVSSSAAQTALTQLVPGLVGHVTVLPDAVALDRFTPAATTGLTVIYTGGFGKNKGTDLLLQAIPLVHAQVPQATFNLIGYPLPDDRPAADYIHYIGQVDYFDLPKYLAQASIAVDPKPPHTTEASGKLFSYAAAGLPVIAFATPTAQQLLSPEQIVTEPTVEQLAATIVRLLQNQTLRQQLGQSNYQRVQAFSWQTNIMILLQHYESLVKQ